MSAYLYGLGVGFSLILAIGAQNAFVLKQGLKQQYVMIVCAICALSDSILIYLGVVGFSKIIQQYPIIVELAKYLGAGFLFFYGLKSLYSAFYHQDVLEPSQIEPENLYKIIGLCLAFTWLNPHVYLDTVILIGSISAQFKADSIKFALGAMSASWIFFFSLGYAARLLLPVFRKAIAWKILDFIIGMMMWGIAISLLV
ncbi:LysE/ArgO family amino acid transporter [Acinetobacter gerneri]|uniref:LysE/ArgO family amino acid transporter n=1 Tax=Acinetobacter gerneri TaxID=202952 RepID=A0AAW8JI66_9GAMM|nr:LysE/ArgO family amino acid transporter [Acinetobacter gerneri]MDQ9009994.1 LysE/ArgO family amino acid transporter [Acinetobacter gerneri]MDQ9014084.1 LysE/ArgO family amino acid transporter [Acinetobacter gerneri]MDQ9025364.1 LysE/ArgO family amino acid transporter [Acinetobacter gerneri]MDQ9052643.1 LysE/ArgO family amino acid transporter [Acinetobacter gerneri]MDQ9060064.1 LysE/ArgO family amino acid transporter [Acinetobacter gerneri]